MRKCIVVHMYLNYCTFIYGCSYISCTCWPTIAIVSPFSPALYPFVYFVLIVCLLSLPCRFIPFRLFAILRNFQINDFRVIVSASWTAVTPS